MSFVCSTGVRLEVLPPIEVPVEMHRGARSGGRFDPAPTLYATEL
jgi:hypothetical protein